MEEREKSDNNGAEKKIKKESNRKAWCHCEKEVENYIYLCEKIKNKDFQKRVRHSFEYYIRNANFYKYFGMTLSILGIILPAFATVLTACDADKCWIACFTAIATVISGILAYLKCFDKHEAYRKAAENMKAELVAYAANQGAYKSCDTKQKDEFLFDRIESIIQSGYYRIVEIDKENNKSKN